MVISGAPQNTTVPSPHPQQNKITQKNPNKNNNQKPKYQNQPSPVANH